MLISVFELLADARSQIASVNGAIQAQRDFWIAQADRDMAFIGRPYNPVVTLSGWTVPWRMNQGVKEFHLVAEPVVRKMTAGFKAHLWGYNGQSPGPTIEGWKATAGASSSPTRWANSPASIGMD